MPKPRWPAAPWTRGGGLATRPRGSKTAFDASVDTARDLVRAVLGVALLQQALAGDRHLEASDHAGKPRVHGPVGRHRSAGAVDHVHVAAGDVEGGVPAEGE